MFSMQHYDHQGVQARVESSKLIIEKIKSIAGEKPVVFMGDLNGNRESEWYLHLASSSILKDSHGHCQDGLSTQRKLQQFSA